jgi:hypothetical protein
VPAVLRVLRTELRSFALGYSWDVFLLLDLKRYGVNSSSIYRCNGLFMCLVSILYTVHFVSYFVSYTYAKKIFYIFEAKRKYTRSHFFDTRKEETAILMHRKQKKIAAACLALRTRTVTSFWTVARRYILGQETMHFF